jgi:hypothetical protein
MKRLGYVPKDECVEGASEMGMCRRSAEGFSDFLVRDIREG